jgi:hypothetical protein
LSAIACLRARLRFAEGHKSDAVDDVLDSLVLARQISSNGVSIMVLLGYSMETRAIPLLAGELPKLSKDSLRDLAKRLNELPAEGSPLTALPLERRSLEASVILPARAARNKDELVAAMSRIFVSEPGEPDARTRGLKFVEECGGTAEGVLKHAAEMVESYPRMETILKLPIDQCIREWEGETKRQANNPVFKVIASRLPLLRWVQLQAETRTALLKGAVAVLLEGPDSLKNRKDPIFNEPFDYVPFDGGFELRARHGLSEELRVKLKVDKKAAEPMSLTVGKRTKTN